MNRSNTDDVGAAPGPPPRSVDLWWGQLNELTTTHRDLLDDVERQRAADYRLEPDRDRFVLGVALTRNALAPLIGCAPAEVPLDRTCDHCGKPHGWPRLTSDLPWQISVSHSGELVLVAISHATPVGVDIEQIPAAPIAERLLRTTLTDRELAELPEAVGSPARNAAFIAHWVAKEAALKATREGLRTDLREVEVHVTAHGLEQVIWQHQNASISRVPAPSGYLAAVAMISHSPAHMSQFNRPRHPATVD